MVVVAVLKLPGLPVVLWWHLGTLGSVVALSSGGEHVQCGKRRQTKDSWSMSVGSIQEEC